MAAHALLRGVEIAVAAAVLCWVPLPAIPGACVTLKNALVVLGCVVALGVFLYNTLFAPRYRP